MFDEVAGCQYQIWFLPEIVDRFQNLFKSGGVLAGLVRAFIPDMKVSNLCDNHSKCRDGSFTAPQYSNVCAIPRDIFPTQPIIANDVFIEHFNSRSKLLARLIMWELSRFLMKTQSDHLMQQKKHPCREGCFERVLKGGRQEPG